MNLYLSRYAKIKKGLNGGGCLNLVNFTALVERFSIHTGADLLDLHRVERLRGVYLSA